MINTLFVGLVFVYKEELLIFFKEINDNNNILMIGDSRLSYLKNRTEIQKLLVLSKKGNY